MRNRIPGRVIVFGVLLAQLCLLPTATDLAFAKPIGWDDPTQYLPPPPGGDNDGVVVKGPTLSSKLPVGSAGGTRSGWVVVRSDLRLFYVLMRLDPWRLFYR